MKRGGLNGIMNWKALFLLIVLAGCSKTCLSQSAVSAKLIRKTYPKLYIAIFKRDARALIPFTSDSSPLIRAQAWRALAHTSVDSLSNFIDKVKRSASPPAWFALSMHTLMPQHLRDLEEYWEHHPNQRGGISLTLGQQGDVQTLAFLLNHLSEINGRRYEKAGALAISRLMIKYQINGIQQATIVKAAFSADDTETTCAWLYGFYRGAKTRLTSALKDTLYRKWKGFGVNKSVKLDQYITKILASRVFAEIVHTYKKRNKLKNHVQLGIELARAIPKVHPTQSNQDAIQYLLRQPNPHVVRQTLTALTDKLKPDNALYIHIKTKILDQHATADVVWLQALNTLAKVDSTTIVSRYAKRLNDIAKNHPYLYPRVLSIWMKDEKPGIFLNRLKYVVQQRGSLKSMYAVNALRDSWSRRADKSSLKSQVRDIVFNALAKRDRGVTYSCEPLLEDSLLFSKADFSRISSYLDNFRLPEDIEVYQTFGKLYKKRFENQAQPVVDSLAALDYAPLNQSLQQSGWDVSIPEGNRPEFRIPNWKRLVKLGRHPVWVLETVKGIINVRMNTLLAPATVSVIDSLTRAGVYNGVPFHRVVPNFVIQGGDIERKDGFGGPNFVIPTEASEQGFIRGAAGIASAGPDTEGSQYFFMNQGSPHLDGHYTLFGHVIKGMNVVDRIMVGDKVKRAYWR